jgi:acetylornithine deacetylase/succinyl-diaminopimelate desuccinylase-like protein
VSRVDAAVEQRVLDRIDELGDELIELTVALADTYCPPGREDAPAAVARDWLDRHEIAYEIVGESPSRPSIIGRIGGAEPAAFRSIVFNSHFDQPFSREDDHLRLRDPGNPKYFSARIDGDRVVGYGAVNDKGPMAAWLIAAKALRDTQTFLGGDMFLTMVSGEIGQAPIDEYQGNRFDGCGMGARDVAAVVKADCALVAEATQFTTVWVECGKADIKITVYGEQSFYTPYLPDPTPSAIVRAARLIPALDEWGRAYTQRESRDFEGGRIVPKVNIGCIRSGVPYNVERSTEVCHFYLDVRVAPGRDPEEIRVELEGLLEETGIDGVVELYAFHAGAQAEGIEPLLDVLQRAHEAEFGSAMQPAHPETSSMWRDIVPFIDAGIPALTYGPAVPVGDGSEFFMTRQDLVAAARVYARVALAVCNTERV